MKFSLLPEKPILVYPSLAATIGLEAATLVMVLSEVSHNLPVQISNRFHWITLDIDTLREATPFWNDQDIQRLCNNLREQGILIIASAPFGQDPTFKFAFNERVTHTSSSTQTRVQPPSAPASKNYIAQNWQPDETTLAQLAQHSIPSAFAYDQVPEFVTYWHERRETALSWGSKFFKHVVHKWRQYEAQRNQQEKNAPIAEDWYPSRDAMDVMTLHAEIPKEFIEDSIPEFILYWRERGDALKTWNSKFIQHVRVQWKKFCSTVEHSTDPKPIPPDWQPSGDAYDVLRLANIDLAFAEALVPEFVLYWKDTNQIHTSWNTRFLQHAKRLWAQRHSLTTAHGQTAQSTREISLEQQLNDRSWAN